MKSFVAWKTSTTALDNNVQLSFLFSLTASVIYCKHRKDTLSLVIYYFILVQQSIKKILLRGTREVKKSNPVNISQIEQGIFTKGKDILC